MPAAEQSTALQPLAEDEADAVIVQQLTAQLTQLRSMQNKLHQQEAVAEQQKGKRPSIIVAKQLLQLSGARIAVVEQEFFLLEQAATLGVTIDLQEAPPAPPASKLKRSVHAVNRAFKTKGKTKANLHARMKVEEARESRRARYALHSRTITLFASL